MLDRNERVVNEFKRWHPTFYERTVKCIITGYHLLLAILDDDTKLEFSSLDNTLRDVTQLYDPEYNSHISEIEWRKSFSSRLKTILYDRSIKQEVLADMLGISRTMLSKYINGKATPSSYNLNRIARALSCDVRDLVDFDYILRK